MTSSLFDTSLASMKALADATRLKLLAMIADREQSVGDLARALALKEPTISHHLAKLQECGLVTMRTDGTSHLYRMNAAALARVGKAFAPARVAALANETAADAAEEKILRTYLKDGRLTKIPDTRKKRDVVLRWLVTRFQPGARYTEPQVNALLRQAHSDFATLRRELIMGKLMRRENNVYWRDNSRSVS